MSVKTKISTACCFGLIAAGAAFGQAAGFYTPCEPLDRHEEPKGRLTRVVLDAPFSAEMDTLSTHTLEDGTKIEKQGAVSHQYRDSLGRTRFERAPLPPMIGRLSLSRDLGDLSMIEISDPIALKEYTLYPSRREAHVQAHWSWARKLWGSQSGEQQFSRPAPADSDLPRPKFTKEYLGTQSIDGLQAVGIKDVTTYPAGWNGNDREYSSTHESWCSLELHVIILNKLYNPDMGETTQRLTNINRSEPDPSLFELPADYTPHGGEAGNGDFTRRDWKPGKSPGADSMIMIFPSSHGIRFR